MANMSYCRFTNTLADLKDCEEHMGDSDKMLEEDGGMAEEEIQARKDMIELCKEIAENYS